MKKNTFILILLIFLLGCKQQQPSDKQLHIAMASSLIHLAPPLKTAFEEEFPNCSVDFSLASSGSLYFQIKNGAPFDFFISADLSWAEKAGQQSNLKQQNSLFAQGELWLWLENLDAIDTNQAITIANPETAPHGTLAKQWLQQQNLWQPLYDQKLVITAASAAKIPFTIEQGGIKQAILPKAMITKLPKATYQKQLPFKVQYYLVQLQQGSCHLAWYKFTQQHTFKALLQEHGFDQ